MQNLYIVSRFLKTLYADEICTTKLDLRFLHKLFFTRKYLLDNGIHLRRLILSRFIIYYTVRKSGISNRNTSKNVRNVGVPKNAKYFRGIGKAEEITKSSPWNAQLWNIIVISWEIRSSRLLLNKQKTKVMIVDRQNGNLADVNKITVNDVASKLFTLGPLSPTRVEIKFEGL